jgi:hypothetical protein
MYQNTSIIITKEYSQLYKKLVHYKMDDYFIIPVNIGSIQFDLISRFEDNLADLDEIFEKIVSKLYTDENLSNNMMYADAHPRPLSHEIDNLDDLLLIELIFRLKIYDFELFHYSTKEEVIQRYDIEFIDGVIDYYSSHKRRQENTLTWHNAEFYIENFPNYDYCKKKYLRGLTG